MAVTGGKTLRDRFWAWAHIEGAYQDGWGLNDNTSRITPYEGAHYLGVPNVIFVRYDGKPAPPFDQYYTPMRMLDQVHWSMTGAAGVTSEEEREHVYQLAKTMPNITGVMLDDFFHFSRDVRPTQHWLAKRYCFADRKPVFLTITLNKAIAASMIEIKQTVWDSGDFRTRDFAIDVLDVSAKDDHWREVGAGRLPNESGVEKQVAFPESKIRAFRVRCLSTNDNSGAFSCGLRKVRLFAGPEGQRTEIPLDDAWAEASSCLVEGGVAPYAQSVISDYIDVTDTAKFPAPASLTVEELANIRERLQDVGGRQLDLSVVCYDNGIQPRSKPHLELCDSIVLFTWWGENLQYLEKNLSDLEQLVPNKKIRLGCYMWDFGGGIKPMPIESMEMQCELGRKWLKEGRIEDMVFLATNICDLNLETVEWTRQWIAKVGDEPL